MLSITHTSRNLMNLSPPTSLPTSIDIVEAAYTLDVPTAEWLERLTGFARALDPGRGTFGYIQNITPTTIVTSHSVCADNPALPAIIGALHAAATPGWADAFHRRMIVTGSFRDFLDSLGESHQRFEEVMRPFGIQDMMGVHAQDGEGWAVGFVNYSATPLGAIARNIQAHWVRVATHLGTALRLRRRLEAEQRDPDAILTPRGSLVSGTTASISERAALEGAVVRMDRARGQLRKTEPTAALSLWDALIAGRWSLVDRIESDGRRFIVAFSNTPSVIHPTLSPREAAIARWVVGGASNKEIAYALGVATSTVGWHLKNALAKLRVRNRVELVALWHHTALTEPAPETRRALLLELRHAADLTSESALTASESEVARAAVAGLSNRAIASRRGTSERTVINLLARVFEKLGVKSRAELAARLR